MLCAPPHKWSPLLFNWIHCIELTFDIHGLLCSLQRTILFFVTESLELKKSELTLTNFLIDDTNVSQLRPKQSSHHIFHALRASFHVSQNWQQMKRRQIWTFFYAWKPKRQMCLPINLCWFASTILIHSITGSVQVRPQKVKQSGNKSHF